MFRFRQPGLQLPLSFVMSAFLLLVSLSSGCSSMPARANDAQAAAVEGRVSRLIDVMTLDEKIKMLSGIKDEMHISGVERLNIPELKFSDGPVGVRCWGKSTANPCGAALAASWDEGLAHEIGAAIGRDSRARVVHVLLGPGVDLYRVPQNGRNFEYFGEDPYLTARLTVGYIKGMQEQGVAASVKHYAANDQETQRDTIDSIVDERRLQEICFPPFRAAVQEAGVATVMAAYNKVNGEWCTANKYLLNDVLRKQWGYKGVLMSDWGAVHDCFGPLTAGCDLEMGKCVFYTPENIKRLLKEGKVTEEIIDEHVRRIVRMSVSMGFLDRSQEDKTIVLNDPTSAAVALKAEREGLVLLRNEHDFLPLDQEATKNIVLLGPNAEPAVIGGGGSSEVVPFDKISLYRALCAACGGGSKINLLPWQKGKEPGSLSADQIKLISQADAVVAAMGYDRSIECEGFDHSYDLPGEQAELIKKIVALNHKTIVVLNAGGNVGMESWIRGLDALIMAWYPGQNGNTAVAEAIFGDLNPSGHLTDTFEKKWEDSPAYGNYPGDPARGGTVKYAEGIYVGYRAFDKKDVEPHYPFSYGLSYTKFLFNNLQIEGSGSSYKVSVDATNCGTRDGATVVQLYVHPVDSAIDRPVKELKGFRRVELKSGQTQSVSFTLNQDSFAYWDTSKHSWFTPEGRYTIGIGASSRELDCKQRITVN